MLRLEPEPDAETLTSVELDVLTASFCVTVPPAATAMLPAALPCVPSSVVLPPEDSLMLPPLLIDAPVAVSLCAFCTPTPMLPSPLRSSMVLPPVFWPLAPLVPPTFSFLPPDAAALTSTVVDWLLCLSRAALKARLPPAATVASPPLDSAVPVNVASPPLLMVNGPPLAMLPATSVLPLLDALPTPTPTLALPSPLPAVTPTSTPTLWLLELLVFLAASNVRLPPVVTLALPPAATLVPSRRVSPLVLIDRLPPALMPPATAVLLLSLDLSPW